MLDYSTFFSYLETAVPGDFARVIGERTEPALGSLSHGDYGRWCAAIESMPEVRACGIDLAADAVAAGDFGDMEDTQRAVLKTHLMALCPWRKGPLDLFGIHIDSEWRSDLKWLRLKDHIDLKDKLVLDVGCGNGYYLFRMLGAGARAAVGVDPFLLSVMQFHAINQYVQTSHAAVLPLGVDDVPGNCGCFDTVFSMGLLYHRRQPQEHLVQLHGFVKPGGQVVLETLILDTAPEERLIPDGRYAKMRNVWSIVSPRLLERWLTEAGFEGVRLVDITKTTSNEQRKTHWMPFESLENFLDPKDPAQTIEGYPAPVRAIVIAEKP